MPKIFFCYRRDDSAHQAGRIFDHLSSYFGKNELFKDVDSIPLGVDFREELAKRVSRCDVLLALIGDIWLTVEDENGRRLDDPQDYVRIEIETALRRGIPVIPVLVGKEAMPPLNKLPRAIRELHYRQGLPIRPDPDFRNDLERLVRGIKEEVGAVNPRAPAGPQVDAPAAGAGSIGQTTRSGLFQTIEKYAKTYLADKGLAVPRSPTPLTVGLQIPRMANPVGGSTIRVAILKSGNATYVNEIERALLGGLETRFATQNLRLSASEEYVDWEAESTWAEKVQRLMTRGSREGFRFLVGIGTQAAVALQNALGGQFGMLPTLLLGVTYPRIAGLVDSEFFRCESRQVMCIRFGCGMDAVTSLIYHRIFPGRKLCFIYQAGTPQDELAHAELCTTRLAREGILTFRRLERRLEADDMADKDTVYYSLYTFTQLFHDKEFSILKERIAVSIMRDNVRDGASPVGIGTDHVWIGDRGAQLISEHTTAPDSAKPDWGSREVMLSPVVYWLNNTLAQRLGINFSRETLNGAREIYD